MFLLLLKLEMHPVPVQQLGTEAMHSLKFDVESGYRMFAQTSQEGSHMTGGRIVWQNDF